MVNAIAKCKCIDFLDIGQEIKEKTGKEYHENY